jgi:drug/metabolite transporter (DMT)-like permease
MVLYGALAMAGAQGGFFNAVRYLPVPVALLIEYNSPLVVILWVWLVRRQPPSRRTLMGGALALFGLTLVVRLWTGFALDWRGVAWASAAAVCAASYFVIADRADTGTSPLALAGVGMAVGTATVALAGLTGALPLTVPRSGSTPVVLAGVPVGWIAVAVLLVVLATVVPYLTGIAAIARIGAPRAALIGLLEVVSSGLASWWLLGEVPAPVQVVGGMLILSGVALTRPPRPQPDAPVPIADAPAPGC